MPSPRRKRPAWRDYLLKVNDLKRWLHTDLRQRDKLLCVLASLDAPAQVRDLRKRASEAGFRVPNSWNPSTSLGRSKGLAIRTPRGWEITDAGKQHLGHLGVESLSAAAVQIATDLRTELEKIKDAETRSFVEEAIKCYEARLYRSAIVMSWIGAVAILHKHVVSMHLSKFNAEAKRVDSRWRNARTADDLGKMKEADFLERIAAVSIIGSDVKKELKTCLDRRNSCGHPNSLQIGNNTVAHHVEVLLLNVFSVFQ